METKEPRRWVMLLLFCGFSMTSGVYWCTYAPIASQAASFYHVDENVVNLFEMSFLIMFFPTSPIATWTLNKSLYWSLFGVNVINAVGGVLRIVANHNFPFALTVQFFLATVNSMALVASATVAEVWFPKSEMVLSTTFTSLANFVGVGIGLVLPPYIGNIRVMLVVEAAFGVVMIVAYVLLGKKDPPRNPHVIAWKDICSYMRQWKQIVVLLLCGSAVGTSYTIIGLFQQILSANNYGSIEAGWAGFLLVMGGMTGGLIATAIVAKYDTFLLPLRIYIVISIIAAIVQCFTLSVIGVYFLLSFLFGLGIVGFVPLAVRMGVEAAYPLDESIPTNIMFTSAQLFSLVYTYPIIYFQAGSGYTGLWGIALCTVVSFVPLFFVCGMNKSAPKSHSETLISDFD